MDFIILLFSLHNQRTVIVVISHYVETPSGVTNHRSSTTTTSIQQTNHCKDMRPPFITVTGPTQGIFAFFQKSSLAEAGRLI